MSVEKSEDFIWDKQLRMHFSRAPKPPEMFIIFMCSSKAVNGKVSVEMISVKRERHTVAV